MNEEKQDSLTIGTPGKGGSLKLYFNVGDDLKESQKRIDNFFAVKTYLSVKHGLNIGGQ